MPNIYEKNRIYYLKKSIGYEVARITLETRTISITGTGIFKSELENPTVYTFIELRKKLIGR